MTINEVVDVLGQPEEKNNVPDGLSGTHMQYVYAGRGLILLFTHPPRAAAWSISSKSPRFRTREGIGVGSSGNEVVRALGTATETLNLPPPWSFTYLDYRALGVYICLTAENVVDSFLIQAAVWTEVGPGRFMYIPAL
jgi:hypothetical protein